MREADKTWAAASRRAFLAALVELRERPTARPAAEAGESEASVDGPSHALQRIVDRFGLSPFERDLLLLSAGCEVDDGIASLVAGQAGARGPSRPTLRLASTLLGEAHWDALSPDGPLRRGRLIQVAARQPLASAELTAEETVVHALLGQRALDPRLHAVVRPAKVPVDLTDGQQAAAVRLVEGWARPAPDRPVSRLDGADAESRETVFAAASHAIGFRSFVLAPQDLPADPWAAAATVELWERDAILHDLTLLLDLSDLPAFEARRLTGWLLPRLRGLIAVSADADFRDDVAGGMDRVVVGNGSAREQHAAWVVALGEDVSRLNGEIGRLAEQFTLSPATIRRVVAAARVPDGDGQDLVGEGPHGREFSARLWTHCRSRASCELRDLAQPIEPQARWDDLVLPEAQLTMLRQLAVHIRRRWTVYEDWGFADSSRRGLGIGAMFWGPSGTGKTFAAEALARELGLDLYRIDLSATVSKYVGETEKNLRRIFDAAERSGNAVLLFDEADALFSTRSAQVRDSHDRHAMREIAFLLQRMESYRGGGPTILTTNLKSVIDTAFLRRLRFIVHFPFPSESEREELWRRVFPPRTPLRGLDHSKLARLSVTGAAIRTIAMDAAFRAADDGGVVSMKHVLDAARNECAKLDKQLSDAEIRGWV